MRGSRRVFALIALPVLAACSSSTLGPFDSGLELIDVGTAADKDTGIVITDALPKKDAEPIDTGVPDDAGTPDSGLVPDSGAPDLGPSDSGIQDAMPFPDALPPDTGAHDSGVADTGIRDATNPDGATGDATSTGDGGTCDIVIDNTACSMCVEAHCCSQLDVCFASGGCSFEFNNCYIPCRQNGMTVTACGNMCFSSPEGAALRSCTFTSCAQPCP